MAQNTIPRTPAEQAELAAFARNLTDLMARRGMSASDLARAVWGSVTDTRGRDVARNRDRISHYVSGTQMPRADTLKKLAEALGVDVADLVPALALPVGTGAPGSGTKPVDMSLTAVGGRPDIALLQINRMVPMRVAVQIISMISGADRGTDDPTESIELTRHLP